MQFYHDPLQTLIVIVIGNFAVCLMSSNQIQRIISAIQAYVLNMRFISYRTQNLTLQRIMVKTIKNQTSLVSHLLRYCLSTAL